MTLPILDDLTPAALIDLVKESVIESFENYGEFTPAYQRDIDDVTKEIEWRLSDEKRNETN